MTEHSPLESFACHLVENVACVEDFDINEFSQVFLCCIYNAANYKLKSFFALTLRYIA